MNVRRVGSLLIVTGEEEKPPQHPETFLGYPVVVSDDAPPLPTVVFTDMPKFVSAQCVHADGLAVTRRMTVPKWFQDIPPDVQKMLLLAVEAGAKRWEQQCRMPPEEEHGLILQALAEACESNGFVFEVLT